MSLERGRGVSIDGREQCQNSSRLGKQQAARISPKSPSVRSNNTTSKASAYTQELYIRYSSG